MVIRLRELLGTRRFRGRILLSTKPVLPDQHQPIWKRASGESYERRTFRLLTEVRGKKRNAISKGWKRRWLVLIFTMKSCFGLNTISFARSICFTCSTGLRLAMLGRQNLA